MKTYTDTELIDALEKEVKAGHSGDHLLDRTGGEMTKKNFNLLGAVFAREIIGYSLQSKSKEYERLAALGFVEYEKKLMHFKDGLPPMNIEGWKLTHAGRIAYCQECSKGEK